MENNTCQLCGFEGKLQRHHLVPQRVSRHKNKYLKNDTDNHIYICDVCHRTIHAYFTEQELKDGLNTIEALKNNDRFSKYLSWREKHMSYDSNSTKMSNHKRK